jgi:hypothetical protein
MRILFTPLHSSLLKTGFIVLILFGYVTANAQDTYKVSLFRAAPGEMLSLLADLKDRAVDYDAATLPVIIRHSQGDHWDYMVVEYAGELAKYVGSKNQTIFTPAYGDPFYSLIAHHEQVFMHGPGADAFQKLNDDFNYFHIEMFVALPGKQEELLKERQMENVYLEEIGRDPNLVFTSVMGSGWDNMTLGGYRDIKHFAESADIPLDVEDAAAKKAGFKDIYDLSPYLRSLILRHNDTLGNKVVYLQDSE